MKTTLTWAICAAIVGAAAGAALGYWEARPWSMNASGRAASASSEPKTEAGAKVPHASLSIDETTFNFDKMESGSTQRHVFPIRNTGTIPLTVEFVSHTCKCTQVVLNGKQAEPGVSAIVKPGDETEVMLEWAAKVAAGPFRHGATFSTNDPANSRLELTVEGEIVESTTLEPSMLGFGAVQVGQPAKAEMFVMSFLEPEVQILSHEVQDAELAKHMTVTIEPVAKDQLPDPKAQAGVKIVAQYNPTGAVGPFGGSLKLHTNLKQATNLEVPIHGIVKGDINIFGKGWIEATGVLRMDPGTTAAGARSQLTVAIRGDHAKDTKLTVSQVEPPQLKATLGEPKIIRDDLVHVPLTLEVPPGTRPMVRAGEDQGGEAHVVLSTTHPATPEVRLRATFTIQP